jgi:hypothetical protein
MPRGLASISPSVVSTMTFPVVAGCRFKRVSDIVAGRDGRTSVIYKLLMLMDDCDLEKEVTG